MGPDSDSRWVRLKGRRAASTNTKEYNHSPPTRMGALTNAGLKVIHFARRIDKSNVRHQVGNGRFFFLHRQTQHFVLKIHIFVAIMHIAIFFPLNLSNKILAIIFNTLYILSQLYTNDYNILHHISVYD